MKNNLMLILLTFLFVPLAHSAQGRKGLSVAEPNQQVARGKAKRLVIVGFSGGVTVVPNNRPDEMIFIRGTKSSDGEDSAITAEYLNLFTVRAVNLGDVVEVRAEPPGQVSDWGRWARGKHTPEIKLEIMAPPNLSLEVYWARGDVKTLQWKAPVFISSQDGRVDVENIAGDFTARTMSGSLKCENIKGAVSIENFSSVLNISNVVGKVRLRTFSGDAHVKKIQGNVVLSAQKSSVNTQDTTGAMDVQSGVGAFHIFDHKGPLVGHSDGGAINAKISGRVEVRLISQTGPLSLSVGRESQASVNLSTKGQLNAPRELEKKSGPDAKIIQGELQGSQPGHLRLSSETGDLSLKVL